MIHSISVFRRSFLYLCILGAFGLVSCTSCKQKNAGPPGPKVDQGADEIKSLDREEKEEIELKLELVFSELTSTTAPSSPSTDDFSFELKNNGSKTIQLAKLKLGYQADLVRTYHGGHETGDAHQDQFIIVQAGSRNDVHNMTLQELTGQAELAAGALVTVKTVVQTGEAVASATTQLKVMEANETQASQAFNFNKQPTPAEAERKLPDVLEDKKNHEEVSNGVGDCPNKHETPFSNNPSDTNNMMLQEPTGQAELAADALVTVKTEDDFSFEDNQKDPNNTPSSSDDEQSICDSDLNEPETQTYYGSKIDNIQLNPIFDHDPSSLISDFEDPNQIITNPIYGEISDEDPS